MVETTREALADVNADLTRRVVVDTRQMAWEPSPSGTVWRKPLYRQGGEFGPVTQSRALCPGRRLPRARASAGRGDPGAERGLLDEHGDYPPGTFLMKSPWQPACSALGGRLHPVRAPAPVSGRGSAAAGGRHPRPRGLAAGSVEGLSVRSLYAQGGHPEQVALVRWEPGTQFQRHTHWGGEEILVLEGEFCDEHGRYPEGAWIRSPHMSQHTPSPRRGASSMCGSGGFEWVAMPGRGA